MKTYITIFDRSGRCLGHRPVGTIERVTRWARLVAVVVMVISIAVAAALFIADPMFGVRAPGTLKLIETP